MMNRHHGIVKEFLDTNFGQVTRIDDLANAREIYNQLLGRQRDIEHQLSVIRTEVPTKIESAIRLSDESLTQGETLIAQKDVLVKKINQAMEECQPINDDLGGTVFQVKEIEKFVVYLQWLKHVEELSEEIQRCISSDNLSGGSQAFTKLIKVNQILTTQHSKCESLMKFTSDTILFWHKFLKDKLALELESVLKHISWPFILAPGPRTIPKTLPGSSGEKSSSKSGANSTASTDLRADFERVFTNLLMIQLPDHLIEKLNAQSDSSNQSQPVSSSHILLPIQLLLRPLRKRFRYHFSGNKQTNSIAKPEWYLTQILNWVGNHRDFLEDTVQPILDTKGHKDVDVLIMFTQGLLQLVCRKLSEDMSSLLYNDDLFSHTVDEILLFDRELRGSHDFPALAFKEESPLNVLMAPDCLQKWISVEKSCALDRLDNMLSSAKAWESQYGEQAQYDEDLMMMQDNNLDDVMVPECAESFITMLLTITDRYKYIPSGTYQLRFLDLQLHLLDDYRIRLTQVLKNETSDSALGEKHFAVLNATHYVANVLREWAENSFFLELKHKRDEELGTSSASSVGDVVPQSLLNLGQSRYSISSDPIGSGADDSVFDGMLRLYDRLYQDGIEQVANLVFLKFELEARNYANESWLTLPPKEEQLTLVVSRTACSMLLVLQERLHLLSRKLCTPLFSSCWRRIADKVDSYLFHQVVVQNRFNVGGAAQLQFDMTRNLFPLFSEYTRKPESYFRRMNESCVLLNLQSGSAMLLSEVLSTPPEALEQGHPRHDPNSSSVKPSAALSDIGVTLLQPDDASLVLRLRVDWPQNM
uniref:RAD50-interacting protein 1-like n=1 Tax=Styela clava TaxID=7725 RepID=UPI001939FB98|nr:RAD50-interacting protein 1-like [Styela clava]